MKNSTAPEPHPSTEEHNEQDHPHACLNGYVYLGYTYVGEDGDEVEAYEAVPCRRCLEDVGDEERRGGNIPKRV